MRISKKIDIVKRQILNALNDREIIKIKICRDRRRKDDYYMEIGDSKNMDMGDSKGSTGLHGFPMKVMLKEIEDEMRGLK